MKFSDTEEGKKIIESKNSKIYSRSESLKIVADLSHEAGQKEAEEKSENWSERLYYCPTCRNIVTWKEILDDAGSGGMGMCDCEWTSDNRVYFEYKPVTKEFIKNGQKACDCKGYSTTDEEDLEQARAEGFEAGQKEAEEKSCNHKEKCQCGYCPRCHAEMIP